MIILEIRLVSNSKEETQSIGASIARLLHAGDVLALVGELGAGKTSFVQGVAHGLEVDPRIRVTSPTFTLINEYRGRLPLYHVDPYRLADGAELYDIGCTEYIYGDGITAIEWANRLETLLPSWSIRITLTIRGKNRREIVIAAPETRAELASMGTGR